MSSSAFTLGRVRYLCLYITIYCFRCIALKRAFYFYKINTLAKNQLVSIRHFVNEMAFYIVWLIVGVALCAGLLFGLITMLIQYVGLFMTGFHTGVLLAIAGLAIYDHFLDSRPTTVSICISSHFNVYSTIHCAWSYRDHGYVGQKLATAENTNSTDIVSLLDNIVLSYIVVKIRTVIAVFKYETSSP